MQQDYETATVRADAAPWSGWTRRLVSVGLIVMVVVGMSNAGPIYGQVLLALTVCLFLFLPIRVVMQRLNMAYNRSLLLVFIVYLLLLFVLFLFLAAPVIEFVTDFIAALQQVIVNLVRYLETYSPGDAVFEISGGNVTLDLNFLFDPLSQIVQGQNLQDLVNVVPHLIELLVRGVGVVGSVAGLAYNFFFVHLLAIMILLELPNLNGWLVSWQQHTIKRQYGVLLQRFDETWTAYLWGAAIVTVIGAILTWALLTLLGIPNALGVTAVTSLVLQIPFFGPALGTVVCALAALSGGSSVLDMSPFALAVLTGLLFFFVRGFVVGNFIYPRIVGKSVEVPGVIVLIALSFFGALAGILGMFLSPVLAAALRDIGIFIIDKLNGHEPFANEPEPAYMLNNFLKQHPVRRPAQDTAEPQ